MPKRKASHINRSAALHNYKHPKEKPEYVPKNESENRISSAGDTQKLIANFPCPKCLQLL